MNRVSVPYYMLGVVDRIATARDSGMCDVMRISYIPDGYKCIWIIASNETFLFTCKHMSETLEAHNLWLFNDVKAIYTITLQGEMSSIQNISYLYNIK